MAKVGRSDTTGIIHEVGANGDVMRSFGRPFGEFPNPAVGLGHAACVHDERVILVASTLHPELRAYSVDGEQLWRIRVPAFRSLTFAVEGRLVRFVYPPDEVWDQTASLFSVARNVVVLQVGRMRGRGSSRYASIRTVFVSARTGRVLGEQEGLPLIKAATARFVYTMSEETSRLVHIQSYRYHGPEA